MDIQVSSNFERYLFYLYNQDAAKIDEIMQSFKNGKGISVATEKLSEAKKLFSSMSVDDNLTCQTIKDVFDKCGEVIDPHTATGVKAALKKADKGGYPVVTLATAHPAKFPEAIRESKVPEAELPKYLGGLMDAPERYEVLPNDIEAVKRFIAG